jgi:hypothetical protein
MSNINEILGNIHPGLNVSNVTKFSELQYGATVLQNAATPITAKTTNITLGNIAQKAAGFGAAALGSLTGIPQVAQIGQSFIDGSKNYSIRSMYAVSAANAMKSIPGVPIPDFRARKFPKGQDAQGNKIEDTNLVGGISTKRVDGAAAAARTLFDFSGAGGFKTAIRSGLYAASSISPFGAYSLFNLSATYGWGDHGNPYALRNDFTAQSHVATQWKPGAIGTTDTLRVVGKTIAKKTIFGQPDGGEWTPTRNLLSAATPFRGDKVNVIDFSQRNLKNAYRWLPQRKVFGVELPDITGAGLTSDFIKFFFTGPTLQAGNTTDEDDIIVFRATINSLSDSFNADWQGFTLIGRGDQNYQYGGFSRDISLDFTVYATDRDEVKPIWRKLNALAGYTAPEYTKENIALIGPWMRITIGDLLNQQPIILKSVGYTLAAGDTPWEINIEKDPQMMQTPHKIDVNLTMTPITDWLPQKGGRFYSLAKRHDATGLPIPGNDNWLSDTNTNGELTQEDLAKIRKKQMDGNGDILEGNQGSDVLEGNQD